MNALVPTPLRVLRVRRETRDTVTFWLDASVLPGGLPFQPGQFTMLYAFGKGEVPISISGDPARPEVLVHTVRNVGAVTAALCAARKGEAVGVRGPFGRPWPLDEARGGDLLVIAGGVGFAPLRSAVLAALARRDQLRQVMVLLGARTPEALLYRDELRRWAAREDLLLRVTVDSAPPGWNGRVGVVPALLDGLTLEPARTTALLCGPEVMMEFTVRALLRRGVPGERIHVSLERNMKCAVGLCGHCMYGRDFVCKDGPVFPFEALKTRFWIPEV